ncbi:unnamed protein product [Citrullus colocynthis]|uniref:Secreted protein n=1 Tax=Citrullus colocynthis TaxID=252529 RepID=A0ABP0XP45_9ROSI
MHTLNVGHVPYPLFHRLILSLSLSAVLATSTFLSLTLATAATASAAADRLCRHQTQPVAGAVADQSPSTVGVWRQRGF